MSMATSRNQKKGNSSAVKKIEINIAERWLDNQDVAQMLHMSKRTLQNLRSSGMLKFTKVGKKCYYSLTHVQEMMHANLRV
jgi:hypothetical protein